MPVWLLWSFLMILLTCLLSVVSIFMNYWALLWGLMEMTLLIALPVLMSNKGLETEGLLKYSLIQISASLVLLISIMNFSTSFIPILAVSLKIGVFPMFLWVPYIFSTQKYFNILAISTVMKIPGFIAAMACVSKTLLFFGLASIILGSISGVLVNNLKSLIAYSSVAHSGWVLALMSMEATWLFYWVLYSLISFFLLSWFNSYNFKTLSQMSDFNLFISGSMILSLAGFPPFLGFYLKVWGLMALSQISLSWALIGALTSVASLYFYLMILMNSALKMSALKSTSIKERKLKKFIAIAIISCLAIVILWA